MEYLLRLRRYLFLSVAAMPVMQVAGCGLDPNFIQNAFANQLVLLTNQLFSSLFTLLVEAAVG